MNHATAQYFETRQQQFQQKAVTLQQRYNRLAIIRIVVFVLFLVGIVYFANARAGTPMFALFLVFPAVFGVLVTRHNKIKFLRNHNRLLAKINQDEMQRQAIQLHGFDDGLRYLDTKHPYAADLDLFGSHSLFQLLNRTTTHPGAGRLAQWMLHAADNDTIGQRQQAVKELAAMSDWRQTFQAYGLHFSAEGETTDQDEAAFMQWLQQEETLPAQGLLKLASWVLPALFLAITGLVIAGTITYHFIFLGLLLNGAVAGRLLGLVKSVTESTNNHVKALGSYRLMIQMLEQQQFTSPYLNRLKAHFDHDNFRASAAIKRLQQLLHFLLSRSNLLYIPVAVIFMLDVHLLLTIWAWRKRVRNDVGQWFEAIHDFEALNSLAGLHHAEPGLVFPTVTDQPHVLEAQGMGHPLLKAGTRVNNNISLGGQGSVAVITGSNMAGKSTFLRFIRGYQQ